jgi:5-methylcytosine-specific restriction enzyme A
MSRAVPEWIGAHDDAAIPTRIGLRIFAAADGRCAECTRKVGRGFERFAYDHIIALINGGEHRESNLQVLCEQCHKGKTREDVKAKAKTARIRAKATGAKVKRPWHPTLRKKMNGEVVPR